MNDFVGFRLRIVSNLIERYSENNIRLPRSKNVTSMVVGFIYRSGDEAVTQKDVCEKFNMSRSSVTGLIDRMEEKGIVERVPFEGDARQKRIVLTERCKKNCNRVFDSLKEFERTITKGMSAEEVKQFVFLLDKVIANVSSVTCDKPLCKSDEKKEKKSKSNKSKLKEKEKEKNYDGN